MSQRPEEHFRHCPRCAAALAPPQRPHVLECPVCGFVYYFNPTVAVAGFVFRDDGRVLFIRRAKEPGLGKLAPPGGFIDHGETAETALCREFQEEVGLELTELGFLCSQVNNYVYREVNYPVLDLFFTASTARTETKIAVDEVAGLEWLEPSKVDPGTMAFPSMQRALQLLQAKLPAR